MKGFTVFAICAAVVSAAPVKDTKESKDDKDLLLPFPLLPPTYGLPPIIPPLGGGIPPIIPPLNSLIPPIIPPLGGGIPPIIPPLGGGIPPIIPPLGGGIPPIIPPLGGGIPPVDGQIPPVDGGNPPGGDGITIPPIIPVTGEKFSCPTGLYSNPQCCSADVLGVADLDCDVPSRAPTNGTDFQSICAASGKTAHCCAVPVAGQALLCVDAVGN